MRPERVGPLLEALLAGTDMEARRAADPVAFVHRYTARADREVAAVLASGLAFGRVAAFRRVLDDLGELLDARGGPARAAVEARDLHELHPLVYRWVKGEDLAELLVAVGRVLAEHGSLEPLQARGSAREGLDGLVGALRAATPRGFDRSRGLRAFFPRPSDGSACKRWCMFLRWMVRRDTVDLGLWDRDPATLIVPVDTHVLRLSRFLGLTERTDGSWRTAEAITASLARLDRSDPVRFDFALAHLGISGACKGHHVPEVCSHCCLFAGCAQVPT